MESVVDGAADVDDAQRRVRLDGGSLKRPLVCVFYISCTVACLLWHGDGRLVLTLVCIGCGLECGQSHLGGG